MSKYVPIKLTQLSANESAAVDAINRNLESIETHINDSVSRSAKTPSQMTADLDMNGKKIINIGAPVNPTDLVRQQDVVADKEEIKQMHDEVMATGERILSAAEVTDEKVQEASTYAALSQAWATKTDGTVDGNEYSSKYYAGESKNYYDSISDISSDITTVAGIASDVTTVAGIKSEVQEVNRISSDISNVASNDSNVTTVASNISDVGSVAASISDVNAVADSISDVAAVAGNETNINKVASDINRVDLVADDISSVHTVAVDISNVIDVAGGIADVGTVATNIADVGTVATNISDVNDCATNMADITTASANAALAKDWATKTDATVDGSDYSSKYYAQQAASTVNDKVNRTAITNYFATNGIKSIGCCINLTASGQNVLLKEGSKYYLGNGTSVDVASDMTFDLSSVTTETVVLFVNGGNTDYIEFDKWRFRATNPTGLPSGVRYINYNGVKIYSTTDGGSTWTEITASMPLGLAYKNSSNKATIKYIFNGIGYIYSSSIPEVFVLPDITYLLPDGRNADGTLKSVELTTNSIELINWTDGTGYVNLNNGSISTTNDWAWIKSAKATGSMYYNKSYYVEDENNTYRTTSHNPTLEQSIPFAKLEWDYVNYSMTTFEIFPVSVLESQYIKDTLGYTPEDVSNKVTSVSSASTDTQYPSAKLLYDTKTTLETSISGKQATITGAATSIASSDLTASKALVSDSSGKVAASSVTATELGYVAGVTSAIQTQINSKQTKATYDSTNEMLVLA